MVALAIVAGDLLCGARSVTFVSLPFLDQFLHRSIRLFFFVAPVSFVSLPFLLLSLAPSEFSVRRAGAYRFVVVPGAVRVFCYVLKGPVSSFSGRPWRGPSPLLEGPVSSFSGRPWRSPSPLIEGPVSSFSGRPWRGPSSLLEGPVSYLNVCASLDPAFLWVFPSNCLGFVHRSIRLFFESLPSTVWGMCILSK